MPLVIAPTAVTLTLTTSMAMLPAVLRDLAIRQPSSTSVHSKKADRWYVVRSPQGSWYLNGEPISTTVLSRTLRGGGSPRRRDSLSPPVGAKPPTWQAISPG